MSEQTTMDARERIVRAATELLAHGGREAVSTRAVSAAAGVQAPTIYRQFGDMRGLMDAVAREALEAYVRQKTLHEPSDDPVEDLRRGWDLHVAFGLGNPAVYTLIYGDPTALADTPAARQGAAILQGRVERVARAGWLRVSVVQAVWMISSAARGVTLSLIALPPEARDPRLAESMRDAVFAAILAPADAAPDGSPGADVATRAVALRAVLGEAPAVLSPAEQHLLGEWLDRLASAAG
ncbi:helix-turn-helix domain-containing protein [Longimicrobium sp.]|uniref:TetR/AcrR family transcriptional regulator n=1 Tax=Longimicrobium sp. TaxID=2029185 RepID=UPI002E31A7AE|nr:helix-turn-helix domain-containing protein [Longimicrobium sp.]HEX6041304.1 helix-turn-helix domain-containing protein [Longimicrobium sp.]